MAVPGANATRLGQGMPGGGAALPPGLPLPGGGITTGAAPVDPGSIKKPRVPSPTAAPALPTWASAGDPRVAQETGTGLRSLHDQQNKQGNAGSTKNITVALGVLDQVRAGKLNPQKAAKLMQGLTAGDQMKLADLVSSRASREGKVNRKELEALQQLQRLPAPTDVEPHDILTNLARDTGQLITGLPAGVGLTAAYGTRDILNSTIPGRKSTSLFKDKILKPVAESYAETYGPALHGDFGKTLHAFHEHPLGPFLDLATIASAGVGTAGRLGKVGEALDAASVAKAQEAVPSILYRGDKAPIESFDLGKVKNHEQNLGLGHYFTSQEDLAKQFGPHVTQIRLPDKVMSKILDLDSPATPEIKRAFLRAVDHAEANTEKTYADVVNLEELQQYITEDKEYFDQIREQAKDPDATVRDLIHGPAGHKAAWGMPEGLFNPEFQGALKQNLSDLGHTGLKQKFDEGARLSSDHPLIHNSDEIALWDSNLVNRSRDIKEIKGKIHIVGGDDLGIPTDPAILKAQPWRGVIRGVINPKTGEAYWGSAQAVGGHETLWKRVEKDHPENEEDFVSVMAHIDPDTAQPGVVLPTLEGEGWERFGYHWEGDPHNGGTFHKPVEFERQIDEVGKASLQRAIEGNLEPSSLTPVEAKDITRVLGSPELYKKPTPEDIANEPWQQFSSGFYNTKTGENIVGHGGSGHDDILENQPIAGRADEKDIDRGQGDWVAYRVVRDERGDVAKINAMRANPNYSENGLGTDGQRYIDVGDPTLEDKIKLGVNNAFHSGEFAPGHGLPDESTHRVFVAYDLGYEGPASVPGEGVSGALDNLIPDHEKATARQQMVDDAIRRVVGDKPLNHLGTEMGYQSLEIPAGSAAEAQAIARDLKSSLSNIGLDHEIEVQAPKGGGGSSGHIAEIPPAPEGLPKLSKSEAAKIAIPAFLKGGGKGGLIDLYDRRKGITHEAEIQNTMKQVADVLDDKDLRLNRRSMGEVVQEVAADIRTTRAHGKARPTEMAAELPSFISAGSTGRALSVAETTLREASDLIRAGAIYLRPAYLPNNWAGNTFMNVVHQGVLAPINLGKSFALDKTIGVRYTRAMDKSMGANPASVVTSGKGRGYVSALTQPIAHIMGAAADQPFRRAAWLHEARRGGYRKLSDVKGLFDKAARGDEAALREISEFARKAQEEIVKFGDMNAQERSLIRNLVFVYSWMRGAGRYAARFPLQHPIQTNVLQKMSGPGNDYTESIMGGVPSFMSGVVPIGRDKDGNPIVVNPFSLNPLGTGLQLLRAAAGTIDVLRNPKSFNKYAQEDIVGLLNPLIGSYIEARSGGQPVKKQLEKTIAAMALVKGLKHPGSGSIYPTSRAEAVGHFSLGSLYPRVADEAAVKSALERENQGNPAAMIPEQLKDFKKATGTEVPATLTIAYRKDLEDLQIMKDYQSHYADSHGASGFRNMPPQNRFEAGIEFLRKYGKIKPETIDSIEEGSKALTTDAEYNEYANAVWNLTGVGQWKDAWNNMMRQTKGKALSRKRG